MKKVEFEGEIVYVESTSGMKLKINDDRFSPCIKGGNRRFNLSKLLNYFGDGSKVLITVEEVGKNARRNSSI